MTLETETLAHDVVVLRSPRLRAAGFVHAFTTRRGGVSRPPFDSLNLGGGAGSADDADAIATNRRRLLAAIGAPDAALAFVHQVHGSAAVRWTRATAEASEQPKADAIVGDDPSVALLVRTADCVPVVVACPRHGCAAVIHAGWRGLVTDAIGAAVSSLEREWAAVPAELLAAIGPCIGAGAYEVGPEVAAAFDDAGLGAAVRRTAARPHADLFAAAHQRLRAAGVRSIDGEPVCTASHADLFYSHRRDAGRTGRQGVVAIPRGA